MTDRTGGTYGTETRIEDLEQRVETLTDALRTVIDGLADDPPRDVRDSPAARGARLAREVLLAGGR
ncbi:hypothetical protein [Streptomyces millisiae]|uniref:Uncharacterized protein n=1 Tax=Streptomyces millisiae TaxID=3075542 RepID=A0ABU2LL21_9ACTN|nr:hypothetical protein [Streptomyces sp. DSM 44918]MDT0318276.1 hypothetical protein [Streptomyces sp. DSM 44918]